MKTACFKIMTNVSKRRQKHFVVTFPQMSGAFCNWKWSIKLLISEIFTSLLNWIVNVIRWRYLYYWVFSLILSFLLCQLLLSLTTRFTDSIVSQQDFGLFLKLQQFVMMSMFFNL